jgi:hypothetical protein
MRSSHNNPLLSDLNPINVIPAIQQQIQLEKVALEANQVLNDRDSCYDIKERIIDLKILLSILRNELGS